MVLFAE